MRAYRKHDRVTMGHQSAAVDFGEIGQIIEADENELLVEFSENRRLTLQPDQVRPYEVPE